MILNFVLYVWIWVHVWFKKFITLETVSFLWCHLVWTTWHQLFGEGNKLILSWFGPAQDQTLFNLAAQSAHTAVCMPTIRHKGLICNAQIIGHQIVPVTISVSTVSSLYFTLLSPCWLLVSIFFFGFQTALACQSASWTVIVSLLRAADLVRWGVAVSET